MLKERPPRIVPLRYSPKPIHDYNIVIPPGLNAGPGHAEFLRNDVQAWNLAFLSHPYERRAEHSDGQFTLLVRRTVNTKLADAEIDTLGRTPAHLTVRGLLQLPAHEFIDRITTTVLRDGAFKGTKLVHRLPLYLAYGEPWLLTCMARAERCLRAPVASEFEPGDEVPHVRDAADLLKKYRS